MVTSIEKQDNDKAKIIGSSMKSEKDKMDFSKIVFIYMLGGLVGTLWETILNLCRGRGFVFCNGSIFTPFNFVYGIGAVVIIVCLHTQTKWWEVYLIGAFGGGVVEYILSFLEEKILGTRSWDYSGKLLNINGRTTLIYMAFWGLLCLAVMFLVYKPLMKGLDMIPPETLRIIAIVMAVIILLDLTVTVSTLLRYAARHAGRSAFTPLGGFIDRVCNDAFMKRRFPAMKFS